MNLLDLLSDNPDRDLLTAYRKVKCDLFYGNCPERIKLAEFEKDLKGNLDAIKKALRDDNKDYFLDLAKQGGYWLCPKSCKPDNKNENAIFAESRKSFDGSVEKKGKAEYRLMADLPIEFHVVTTLWILSVGEVQETAVSDVSYGNRIRRTLDGTVSKNALGTFTPYSYQYRKWRDNAFNTVRNALDDEKSLIVLTGDFSSFYHTLKPDFLLDEKFVDWVAEATSILRNEDRWKHVFKESPNGGWSLSGPAERFTHIVVQMLKKWAEGTPLNSGLPVGCSISSVIANLALSAFDRTMRGEVVPLYYGRYVDDFILVMENTRKETTLQGVWNWIADRFPETELSVETEGPARSSQGASVGSEVITSISYMPGTAYSIETLHLNVSKIKAFFLEGENGRDLVETIRKTVERTKSEWRLLPEWIENDDIAAGIRNVIDDKGCDASSFRVVKSLTSRRADLSLKIRRFEAYERLIPDNAWKAARKKLLHSVLTIMDSSFVFDFQSHLFRLFGLFLRHLDEKDEEECRSLLEFCDGIFKLSDPAQFKATVIADEKKWIRDRDEIREKELGIISTQESCHGTPPDAEWCRRYMHDQMLQAIEISQPERLSTDFRKKLLKNLDKTENNDIDRFSDEVCQTAAGLFFCDLAARPLRMCALDGFFNRIEKVSVKDGARLSLNDPVGLSDEIKTLLLSVCNHYQTDWKTLSNAKNDPIGSAIGPLLSSMDAPNALCRVSGWYCSTRPFSFTELHSFLDTDHDNSYQTEESEKQTESITSIITQTILTNYLLEARGYNGDHLAQGFPKSVEQPDSQIRRICIGLKNNRDRVRVAVANWKTDEASWVASIVGQQDPCSATRYSRFAQLMNRVLSVYPSVDYVVFPELSIPVKWYFDAAIKLNRAKISLIAGVEYLHHGRNEVSNEVWCSLHLDSMRFPAAAIVPFRKSKPALEEAAELWKLAHRQFSSGKGTGVCRKICQHGSFCFSVLICSELLEVANRAWMTGRVDALFVPEWNKDTETFDALVEATAMDLHTYVVQCNDRAYGDSRIRCPAKKAHKRDLLRVRGGELDDFNVGTIPFDRLRRFQSSAIPPTGPGEDYKPTPPGFVIADYRRALPCRSPETES